MTDDDALDDIRCAVAEAGWKAESIAPLLPPNLLQRDRICFRVETSSGAVIKARRMDSEQSAAWQHGRMDWLRDLSTTSGTQLVRRAGVALPAPVPISDHLIADGDEAQLGEYVVRFALHAPDESVAPA